jgi:alpha-1,3/alpha-1,6-mannosyltransferase
MPWVLLSPCCSLYHRFERKKGLGLALQALAELKARQPGSKAVLVVAGGYDTRLAENREHLQELKQQAADLGLTDLVAFVPSFTDR